MTTPLLTSIGRVRQLVAAARGAVPTDTWSPCAVCGSSPYPPAGPTRRVLGIGFADWATLIDRAAPTVCAGCRLILSGRPGDDPPPLRTRSLAIVAGALHILDHAAMWTLLTTPPDDLEVLSWAVSGQRQHVLWADACQPPALRIGADGRTIRWHAEREAPLVEALLSLRRAKPTTKPGATPTAICTRGEIETGQYRPAAIAQLGARAWREAETIVARARGTDVLAIALAHCPITVRAKEARDPMIDPTDADATALLGALVRDSEVRKADGLRFWGGLLTRRLQRYSRRSLADFVSAMLAELRVPPSSPGAQATCALVAEYPPDRAEAVMAALRARPTLLVALTFDAQQAARQTKPASAPRPAVRPEAAPIFGPDFLSPER